MRSLKISFPSIIFKHFVSVSSEQLSTHRIMFSQALPSIIPWLFFQNFGVPSVLQSAAISRLWIEADLQLGPPVVRSDLSHEQTQGASAQSRMKMRAWQRTWAEGAIKHVKTLIVFIASAGTSKYITSLFEAIFWGILFPDATQQLQTNAISCSFTIL